MTALINVAYLHGSHPKHLLVILNYHQPLYSYAILIQSPRRASMAGILPLECISRMKKYHRETVNSGLQAKLPTKLQQTRVQLPHRL